jgi:hypothetical protein
VSRGHDEVADLVATWSARLEREGRVELPLARGRTFALLLLALVFALLGVALIASSGGSPRPLLTGVLALGFFGGGGVAALVRFVRSSGPPVLVTTRGVLITGMDDQGEVPWSQVVGVGLVQVRSTRMVTLQVSPDYYAERLRHRGAGARLVGAANRAVAGPQITLPTTVKAPVTALGAWLDLEARRRGSG